MTTLNLCKDELCELCGAVKAALQWQKYDGGLANTSDLDDDEDNVIYAAHGQILGPYWRINEVLPTHYLRVPAPPK